MDGLCAPAAFGARTCEQDDPWSNLPRSMLRRQHVAPYNLWTRYGTLIAFADEVGDAIQRGRFPVAQRQLQCNHGCGSTASDDVEFRYLHISVRSPNRSS